MSVDKNVVTNLLSSIDPGFLSNVRMDKTTVRWSIFPGIVITRDNFSKILGACRFDPLLVCNLISTISLLISTRIQFCIETCLEYLNLIYSDPLMRDILRLPLVNDFLKDLILHSLLFENKKTFKRQAVVIIRRVRHLFLKDCMLFQDLVTHKTNTSRGIYRLEQTILTRLLNIRDSPRYDLHILRLSKENRGENTVDYMFKLTSKEIKNISSATQLKLKVNELNKTQPPIEPIDNSLSNTIQLFNKTTNMKRVLVAKNIIMIDGSMNITLSRKYEAILPDYELLFLPSICSYLSRTGPVPFSASGLHKSPQKHQTSVQIGRRLVFDVMSIDSVIVNYMD